MKSVKVKLAFPSEKPVNFRFGEVNVKIDVVATAIDQQYAEAIQKQYPGWIELVIRKASSKPKRSRRPD